MTDVKAPLAQLAADNQGAARTLDQFGLDYCSHGEWILVDGRRDFGSARWPTVWMTVLEHDRAGELLAALQLAGSGAV